MSVEAINHINICAPLAQLKIIRNFYQQVLGMAVRERYGQGMTGYWLYAGDAAILHLMEQRDAHDATPTGSGHIDHIALSCSDLAGMEQHLQQADIAFRKREAPEEQLTQLFITDPAGIKVELNFRG